jgi:crotonobetainyl-CoA:carnitine CoA-transferase CaiB-like acyl-CoA transferase
MTEQGQDGRAFTGIRVVDFSQGIAGPYATMLLGLHGADVVKIEPSEGDWSRGLSDVRDDQSAHSVAYNRSKRSLALDLKTGGGKKVTERLLSSADVVVESFRPGVIDRLGYGYAAAAAANPAVIFCSISGFGQSGPYSRLPTVDGLIQAFSGMMHMNRLEDGTPGRIAMSAVDVITGLFAFTALSTALMRKFRFGKGGFIDCSMANAATAFQTGKLIEHVISSGRPSALYVPAGVFATEDGFVAISSVKPKHFESVFEAIGRPDIAVDQELASQEKRIRAWPRLKPILGEALKTRSTNDWLAVFRKSDVLCEKVNSYDDYLTDDHVRQTSAVRWSDDSGLGPIPIASIPGLDGVATTPRDFHSPHIGEHTVEILSEAGFSAVEIADFLEVSAAFKSARSS